MSPKTITSLKPGQGLGDTPLRANLRTGEVFFNPAIWPSIPFYEKMFMLFHEEGHIVLQTRDEETADNYAFGKYVMRGYSLNCSVKAMTRYLTFQNSEHHRRAYNQLIRALKWDANINKNPKAVKVLDRINQANEENLEDGVSFLGFGKKARERREEKREGKQQARLERIKAKGEARANVAEKGGGIGGLFSKIGNALGIGGGSATGAGGGAGAGGDEPPPPEATFWEKNKTWIIIAIVVIVILTALYFWKKSKKK